ncbi:MAG: NADH-quinone oxidoreductase subunit NuoB, partial [Candidatus Heimdallarchaeota archaeon]|nr:NADH-quinone oxidoreductase subunit NuoB [Candidatus Heimdallarchaeota archaeon]
MLDLQENNKKYLLSQPLILSYHVRYQIQVGLPMSFQSIKNFIEGRVNWARRSSLWPLTFGIMCCALEMMAAGTARFDTERFGMIYRPSPRQSDALVINGPVSHKLAPRLRMLWEQIPEPKWAVSMGECATSGGKYYQSYAIIGGADEIIPIDVYIPGCPVRPEALIFAMTKLQEKIAKGSKWVKPNIPEYMEYDDQIHDLVNGNNQPWEKMAYEEVQNIPSMGPLTSIPITKEKD